MEQFFAVPHGNNYVMKAIHSLTAAALAVALIGLAPAASAVAASAAPASTSAAGTSDTGTSDTTWQTRTVFTGPRALNRVEVYAPTDGLQHPALLYLHGGGWKISNTEADWVKRFKIIAQEQNWVLGIGYYPTTAHGRHTVRATEAHAVKADLDALRTQPDVDSSKVAIYGQSAGGQLGALIAYQHPSDVAAVVLSSGPVNMITENHSIIKSDVEYYEGETYAQSKRKHDNRYWSTSPTSYITSLSPPTYAFVDKKDPIVPSSQYKELRRTLKQAGVEHRVMIFPGSVHSPEDAFVPGDRHTAEQEGIDFINRAVQ